MKIGGSISGAWFDEDIRHRYALWRIWDRKRETMLFIGLNPSTAAELRDDPTITRLIGFAKYYGFGALFAGNLYSLIMTDSKALFFMAPDRTIGPMNDQAIQEMRGVAALAVVGWGALGRLAGKRPAEVLGILGAPVYCLKKTKEGEPGHPLYLPWGTQLKEYTRRGGER